jgi:hypothetical protein
MNQFTRRQNVGLYRRLLASATNESERQTLITLLGEEQAKQKNAGDPISPHHIDLNSFVEKCAKWSSPSGRFRP